MPYRLLLDENVERVVGHRLENYGHDVTHVDLEPELGKGTDDASVGSYTLSENRVLVTYDDDFVLSVSEDAFVAALYIPDASLSVEMAADIIHEISRHYPQEELQGIEYVGPEWL